MYDEAHTDHSHQIAGMQWEKIKWYSRKCKQQKKNNCKEKKDKPTKQYNINTYKQNKMKNFY